jgi:hypothetical protein
MKKILIFILLLVVLTACTTLDSKGYNKKEYIKDGKCTLHNAELVVLLPDGTEVGNGFFITFWGGEEIEVEGWLGLTLDFLRPQPLSISPIYLLKVSIIWPFESKMVRSIAKPPSRRWVAQLSQGS